MIVPSAFAVAVPLEPGVTLVKVRASPSGSKSLASTAAVAAVPWTVVIVSSIVSGAVSAPCTTLTVTRAEATPPRPSEIE